MELNRDIQCLRGISVLLVVVVHFGVFYSLLPYNLAKNGFIGVDLFFVISGYIITKSIFNTEDRGQFLIKRIFRLIPLALFWMLLHGTISFYVEKFDISTDYLRPHSEIATEALNFISLTMNENMGSSFPHYWSLVVEWHFYIAVMLLMPLIKSIFRLQITTAFLLLATLINLNSLFTDNPFGTVNRLFEFIVGVYIALIPYKFKFSNRLVMTIFMLAFIFLLWISPNFFQYSKENFSRSIIVYGVISGCIVYIASLNKDLMANMPIVGKALFNVGAISYSIYICHITIWNIFQTIIAWHAKSPPLWLHLLILFVSLFTISFLLYKYIEQPMRKIGALLVKKL